MLNSIKSLFAPAPSKNDKSGFTLVELLVVIAIIGILATLLLLQLAVARGKARDVQRIAHINQLRTAAELWFDDHSARYPDTDDWTTLIGAEAVAPKYIGQLPIDPLASDCDAGVYNGTTGTGGSHSCYGYAFGPSTGPANKFQIWAELEQWAAALGSDADIDPSTDWVSAAGTPVNGSIDDVTNCTNTDPNDCIYDQGVK